eukprot:m.90655 g.90655  ORF g.90655 m.90655 type:complete len:528 (+) comp26416_c0_seq1:454-2037(+)
MDAFEKPGSLARASLMPPKKPSDRGWLRVIPVVLLLAAAGTEMQVATQEQIISLVCNSDKFVNHTCGSDAVLDDASTWSSYIQIGFGIAAVLASSCYGSISDRYGRKSIMFISVAGNLVTVVCAALVGTLNISAWKETLILANVVGGLSGGTTITLMGVFAYIADSCPPHLRSVRFPIIEAVYAFGGFGAYYLGGLVATLHGETSVLWVITGLFVMLLLYIPTLPETRVVATTKPLAWHQMHSFKSIASLLQPESTNANMWSFRARLALVITFLLAFLSFLGGFSTTTVIFKTSRYGWSDYDIGVFNAMYSGGRALALLLSVAISCLNLSQQYKVRLLPLMLVICGISNMCISFSTNVLIASFCGALAGVTIPISFGYLRAMVSSSVDATMQGEALAALSFLESVDSLLAPMLFNNLFKVKGSFPKGSLAIWTWGGLSILAAFPLLWVLFKRDNTHDFGSFIDSANNDNDNDSDSGSGSGNANDSDSENANLYADKKRFLSINHDDGRSLESDNITDSTPLLHITEP